MTIVPDTAIVFGWGTEALRPRPVRPDAVVVVFEELSAKVEGSIDMSLVPAEVIAPSSRGSGCNPQPVSPITHVTSREFTGGRTSPEMTYLRIFNPMIVRVDRLPVVLGWLDATFPNWRTDRGAYSPYSWLATDYTAEETNARFERERFWGTLGSHLDGEE